MTDDLPTRFNRMFANLPIPERANPIYVSQKYGAMSWNVVSIEVRQATPLGAEALEAMARLGLI